MTIENIQTLISPVTDKMSIIQLALWMLFFVRTGFYFMTYKEQIQHPKWQKKRLEILQRDGFKCQYCKSEDHQLHVHHLIYISGLMIWEYDNELLITLCFHHHDLIHGLNKIIALIAKNIILKRIDYIRLNNIINQL